MTVVVNILRTFNAKFLIFFSSFQRWVILKSSCFKDIFGKKNVSDFPHPCPDPYEIQCLVKYHFSS